MTQRGDHKDRSFVLLGIIFWWDILTITFGI